MICPLCERTPEKIPKKMNPQDKLSMLFSHIGNHLWSLAFFSLPSLDGSEANDTDASSSGAKIMSEDSKEIDTSRGLDNHSGNDSAMLEIPLVYNEDDNRKALSPNAALPSAEHLEGPVTSQDLSFFEDQDVEWESFSELRQEFEGEDLVLDGMRRFQEQKQKEPQLTDFYQFRRTSKTATMKLLQLNKLGKLNLTKFIIGDNIPPYAILSHTWGGYDKEVTFQDLAQDVGKSKVGYRKIQFCEEQATRDGLQYVWVDTCCIDKSNSTELSEAINSMFRWYRGAAKCYVYLSDVSTHDSDENDRFSEFTWSSAFRNSRWFTRGWALQELIAPVYVEFFSREGKRLGDKKSLEQEVHKITGIPINALHGSPLSHFTASERISWAANRETTRKDDKAYSLMGIFDIHMPLIYGEGREKAFIRLREAIDKRLRNSWIVPFERNGRFTGRELQLAQLIEKLFVEGQYGGVMRE